MAFLVDFVQPREAATGATFGDERARLMFAVVIPVLASI
jgi:hypothetical protein